MAKIKSSLLVSLLTLVSLLGTGQVARAIVTTDKPDNHLAPLGQFTGVVSLGLDNFGLAGTGSLLKGGAKGESYILTAAHVLTRLPSGTELGKIKAVFSLPNNIQVSRAIREAFVFPGWQDDGSILPFIRGGDIAILKLAEKAPTQAISYDIYRNTDEIGKVATLVGYGDYGTGATGAIQGTRGQKKLFGNNRVDALIDAFKDVLPITQIATPGSQLVLDFDNGSPINDASGAILGIPDLGLGKQEVFTSVGDSGGPLLIANKIAGLNSYEAGFPFIPSPPDIDSLANFSFGELSSSTRVSFYADFVDDVLAGKGSYVPIWTRSSKNSAGIFPLSPLAAAPIPEPSPTLGLLILGGLGASSLLKLKR